MQTQMNYFKNRHANKLKRIKLLYISDPEKAFSILAEHGGESAVLEFSSLGHDPDGNAYLAPVSVVSETAALSVLNSQAGWIVIGYEGEYPPHYYKLQPSSPKGTLVWCGYRDKNRVYWSDDITAILPEDL